ncbi:MAG: endo-1,4-beta-xylanase [Planctomycetaceae bacterium]|nr:endo-1,4-beta-xylanase [Planctomycetaceae bacterium]
MPNPTLRFQMTASGGLTQPMADRISFCGLDQIPVPCRAQVRDGVLNIERPANESGRVLIPYHVPDHGEMIFSTGTLMYRDRPYLLEVELARGKVNQIRNQLSDWMMLGLQCPEPVQASVRRMIGEFARGVTAIKSDPAFAVEQSRRALALAIETADLIADTYVEQALALRHRGSPQLPTWLSGRLPPRMPAPPIAELIQTAFNTFSVPLTWRNVEPQEGSYNWDEYDDQIAWCHSHGAPVIGGPLLWLDPAGMPDWVKNWARDAEGLAAFACEYVSTIVGRYRGKVAMWEIAARINSTSAVRLTEDQRLQLAIRLVDTARRNDPDTPCVLRFDQPWGEYLAQGREHDLTPLHLADALVRSGLQLGGVGLEFNVGYRPGGTTWRDRLDFSKLLDMWSYLGLPLHVTITAPSKPSTASTTPGAVQAVPQGSAWSNDMQAQFAQQMLPLLMSKSFIHSITWGQISDGESAEFPGSGVLDEFGRAKPALAAISHLRRLHLH